MRSKSFLGLLITMLSFVPSQRLMSQVAEGEFPTGYPVINKRMNESKIHVTIDNVHSHSLQGFTIKVDNELMLAQDATTTTFNDLKNSKGFDVSLGSEILFEFTNGTWAQNVWVGCDWNRNGSYDNGEVYTAYPEGRTGGSSDSGSMLINVPLSAEIGKSVIRIISDGANNDLWNTTSPMTGTYGAGCIGYAGSLHDLAITVLGNIEERTISATATAGGTVAVNGGTAPVTSTKRVTLVATPNAGYKFVCWKLGEDIVSYENRYVDDTTGDKTYTAVFELDYYTPTTLPSGNKNKRYVTEISLTSQEYGQSIITLPNTYTQFYIDKTADTPLKVATGETLNLNVTSISWMHTYIYIDKENNGFSSSIDGNAYPLEDFVSYSAYNPGSGYKNSKGESVGDNTQAAPEFKFPEVAGTYRMRVKVDWNNIDPNVLTTQPTGSGVIVDVMLNVVEPLPSRTITVSANPANAGEVTANNTPGGVTADRNITLNATANEGYVFLNWTLGDEIVSTNATYTDVTIGDKEYVANFRRATATELYSAIDKPTFAAPGNTSFISAAAITTGSKVIKGDITIDNPNKGQKLATAPVKVMPGARFNLDVTYVQNWCDLILFQIEDNTPKVIYGPYAGNWAASATDQQSILTNMANAGVPVDGNTAKFGIEISEDAQVGDLIVVRSIIGDNVTTYNPKGVVEGGYVDFLFEVVDPISHTLNVTSAGWATLMLGYDAKIPAGATCYAVSDITADAVKLTKVEGVLPEKTAVLVEAPAGDYDFIYSETAGDAVESKLQGTLSNKNIVGPAYVLGKPADKEVGLYPAELNISTGTNGTAYDAFLNNANKAYLPASLVPEGVQGSNSFSFRFDEGFTTGVENVDIENAPEVIYTIGGTRVNSATLPGLYIVNGKKVYVK